MQGADVGDDPQLGRFLSAQAPSYDGALAQLRAGSKRGHWIWYILPQLRGLGVSHAARLYGLRSIEEARAYLAHPLLGARLRECVAAIGAHRERRRIEEILGELDAMKYRSCLTLFKQVEGPDSVFAQGLADFFGAEDDPRTLELLGLQRPARDR
jgi:uncharacterized protein (DUF1810 family)